ncbi:uncharacterized protein LOC113356969 [Papaver somniferum]|uniref:uncharacterized protein LOC113356969 n=1 Tax=Papaver somniferum TaxID=3469 RepID=UPI000E7037D8|nr:uncharacterized protein LOC113356969 [Papaver somniferum]
MRYNKAINVLKPGEKLVHPPVIVTDEVGEEAAPASVDDEVVDPQTQTQQEGPVIKDWESFDEEFWQTTFGEEEDIVANDPSQHTSQVSPLQQPSQFPMDIPSQQTSQQTPQQTPKKTPWKRSVSKSPATKRKLKYQPIVELDEEHDTLEALLADEELDALPESTNLKQHSIHDFPIEDDYHSGNSSSSDDDDEEGNQQKMVIPSRLPSILINIVNRSGTGKNRMANSDWVASVIEADILEDEHLLQPKKIIKRLKNKHGVDISYWVDWKSKGKALSKIFGSYEDGYKWIPEVLEQIKKKNRGSIGVVATDMDKDFSYCCLSFKAYLEGFKNGCMPFIGLDGCHLNGKYGGVLLSTVALGANNGMYPLAIFICDCENKENWILFLNLIKDMLLEHPAPLTFISDRQKGLIPALQIVFPSNITRYCFRHMYENFKTKHKGVHMKTLAWGAAKAYRDTDHTRFMALMEKDNKKAHQWFEDVSTIQWARSTFDHTSKCEHVTINFTECLNSWLVELRCKPIHRILEGFNLKMMSLIFDRKMIAKKWEAEVVLNMCCCVAFKPEMEVNRPKFKSKVGKPRTKRIRSDVEGQESYKKATRSCTHCGSESHNIRRCPTKNNGSAPRTLGKGRGRGRGRGVGAAPPSAGTSAAPPSTAGRGRGRGVGASLPAAGRGRGANAAPPPPGRGREANAAATPPPAGRGRGDNAAQGRGRGFEYLLFGTTTTAPTQGRGKSTPLSSTSSATIGNYQHLYGSQPDGMREPSRPRSQVFKPPRWTN